MTIGLGKALVRTLSAFALISTAGGCHSPLEPRGNDALRDSILDSVRREFTQADLAPTPRLVGRESGLQMLDFTPLRLEELNRMAGPDSYDPASLVPGESLVGTPASTVTISLERAITTALKHNLELRFAEISPAISRTQIVQAEAAFDWTFTSNLTQTWTDTPRPTQLVGASRVGVQADVSESTSLTSGLQRRLASGATLNLRNELLYTDVRSPGLTVSPNPQKQAAVAIQFDQPLLRGFGSDFALSQVRLERNAERDVIAQYKSTVIDIVTQSEQAYWSLVQAHRNVLILERLLERGIRTREQVKGRAGIDATDARIADAVATVERRKGDVLRARLALEQSSDRLKVLMNDPDLTLGSLVLLLPGDEVPDQPITFSLRDALLTAIANRPQIHRALISLDNTGIRLQQAASARLPQLDLRLQARAIGLEDDFRSAYDDVADRQFVEYIVGLNFAWPLGNREAESLNRRRRLEQMQATIAYRDSVMQVTREVIEALRTVVTAYRLIDQARVSRLTATEVLRTYEIEQQVLRAPTAERLDLEFRNQAALAAAEQEEVLALIQYGSAIASLYSAMGTTLERNRIQFVVPDPKP